MDEEDFKSFKTDIDSVSKAEFMEREVILKSELAQVISVSNQNVVDFATENILQQQAVMSNKIAQLEAAAEGRVQREAAAAKSALVNAQQKMSQENKKEFGLVLDLYKTAHAEQEAVFQQEVECL